MMMMFGRWWSFFETTNSFSGGSCNQSKKRRSKQVPKMARVTYSCHKRMSITPTWRSLLCWLVLVHFSIWTFSYPVCCWRLRIIKRTQRSLSYIKTSPACIKCQHDTQNDGKTDGGASSFAPPFFIIHHYSNKSPISSRNVKGESVWAGHHNVVRRLVFFLLLVGVFNRRVTPKIRHLR